MKLHNLPTRIKEHGCAACDKEDLTETETGTITILQFILICVLVHGITATRYLSALDNQRYCITISNGYYIKLQHTLKVDQNRPEMVRRPEKKACLSSLCQRHQADKMMRDGLFFIFLEQ